MLPIKLSPGNTGAFSGSFIIIFWTVSLAFFKGLDTGQQDIGNWIGFFRNQITS
jgi:hypothetical protein